MKILFYISITITFLIIGFDYFTKPYSKYYGLDLYIGKKRTGKTTLLTKFAMLAIMQDKTVYSNVDIEGTIFISARDLGKFKVNEDCLVLLDEANLDFDSRDFSNFPIELRNFLTLQGHHKAQVKMFCQSYDACDKKIRILADNIYLVNKYFRIFSVARRVVKNLDPKSGADDSIPELFSYAPLLASNSLYITYIPAWSKYFDSFIKPDLPEYPLYATAISNPHMISKISKEVKKHAIRYKKNIKKDNKLSLSLFKNFRFFKQKHNNKRIKDFA